MRVGVIGTGLMGKNHARIYGHMKGVELVAISDVNKEAGTRVSEKHKCGFHADYKKLIGEVDVVSICVPTFLHHKIASDFLRAGVHVLVEKPIAATVEEGEELVRLAKENGVSLAVGHIERFNPAVQKLKGIIDSGKLGEVTSILARRVGLFPPRIKDANVIIDLAVHDIDVFSFLLGKEPKTVNASGGRALIRDREDYADIFLKYDGANGLIEVNWITPIKIRTLHVTGTKGYAELNYITQDLEMHESIYEKLYDEFGDFVVKFGESVKKTIKVSKEEPLKLELESFIDSLRKGERPLVSGEEGLQALKTASDIIKMC